MKTTAQNSFFSNSALPQLFRNSLYKEAFQPNLANVGRDYSGSYLNSYLDFIEDLQKEDPNCKSGVERLRSFAQNTDFIADLGSGKSCSAMSRFTEFLRLDKGGKTSPIVI
jgi:hypothetical protein